MMTATRREPRGGGVGSPWLPPTFTFIELVDQGSSTEMSVEWKTSALGQVCRVEWMSELFTSNIS